MAHRHRTTHQRQALPCCQLGRARPGFRTHRPHAAIDEQVSIHPEPATRQHDRPHSRAKHTFVGFSFGQTLQIQIWPLIQPQRLTRRRRQHVELLAAEAHRGGGGEQQVGGAAKAGPVAQPDPSGGEPEQIGCLAEVNRCTKKAAIGCPHTHHHVAPAPGIQIHPLDLGSGIELAEAIELVWPRSCAPLHGADAPRAAAQSGAIHPGAQPPGTHLGLGQARAADHQAGRCQEQERTGGEQAEQHERGQPYIVYKELAPTRQ
ncbi:MAG: hypothetical protein ACKO28_08505 [Cyanobium sp.]